MVSTEKDYGLDYDSIKKANEGFHRLTKAFGLSPTATVITSHVGLIEYANPVFLSMSGYTQEDIEHSNHLTNFFDDDSSCRLAGEIIPLLHSAKNWVGEMSLRRKDGSEYSADMFCSVIIDDTGEPTHLLFNLYDITKRKKNEDALKQSRNETLFKNTLLEGQSEASIDGILVVDSEGKSIIQYNNRFLQMWNVPKDFPDLKDDIRMLSHVVSQVKEQGKFLEKVKYLYEHKDEKSRDEIESIDGRTFERYSSPLIDANGKNLGRIWYFHDITVRKKAGEELKKAKIRLDLAVDASQMGVWELDLITDTSVRNLRHDQIFGYNEGICDWGAKIFFEHIVSEDRPTVQTAFNKAMENDRLFFECRIIWPDKSIHWITGIGKTVRDIEGKPHKIIGTLTDITFRKNAEDALRESRRRLADIIDFLPDATFVVDTQGKVIAWNKSIEQMTGVKAENIVGKGNYEYSLSFYNERRPILIDFVLKPSLENEKKYSMFNSGAKSIVAEVYSSFLKKYLWGVAVALYDDKGTITGAIESIRDITEKKKIDNALKSSESKFKTFFNSASDAVFIIDPEGHILEANQVAGDALGYSGEEIKKLTLENVTGEGVDFFKQRIKNTIDLGSALFEGMHKRKDGSSIPVEVNSRAIDYEGKKAVLSICRDITERRKSEEKLRITYNDLNDELKRQEAISKISSVYLSLEDFEESTRKVLKVIGEVSGLSRVCIFENDPDGKSTTNTLSWESQCVNPLSDGLKIVSFDELPSFNKLMHEKGVIMSPDVTTLSEDLSKALLAREIKSVFILPITVNNEFYGYITFSETREKRDWNYSDIIFLTTVSQIISEAFERKIADEQLKKRNEEIENSTRLIMNINKDLKTALEEQKRLEKLKTEFLSVTSHELRTPITPMKAQLQMVLGEYFGTLTKEQRSSLEMILRNATRLDHLICDILDISKLESGNLKLVISSSDLNELVKNAVETLKYNADEKNIALEVEYESVQLMSLDKDRITQVIMNLITNAVKFTDPGGRITIRTIKDKDKAIVEVTDSGIGMKEEDMKCLFTPFFQVDSSRSRNHEGTGLGLAICKGIVINHGGEINVRSIPGKGSAFSFTLPYNETTSTKVIKEVELFKLK
jgi:PAS domain S-box-containing protein